MKHLLVLILTFIVTIMALDIYTKRNKTLELIARYGTGEYAKKIRLYDFLQDTYKENPALRTAPEVFTKGYSSPDQGYSYSYYGYNFMLPWRRLNRLQIDKDVAGIRFDNGVSVIIVNPEIERQQLTQLVKSMDYSRFGEAEFKQLLDNHTNMSTFDFYNGVLSAQVHIRHLVSPYNDLLWLAILTAFKVTMLGEKERAIYSFSHLRHRALQIGSPEKDRDVGVYVFPEKNRPVKFIFRMQKPNAGIQVGINQLITTVE